MKRSLRLTLIVVGAALLIGAGVVVGLRLSKPGQTIATKNEPIPSSIAQSLSFPVYVPNATSGWVIDMTKTSYDSTSGVLSMTLTSTYNSQLVLTQQSTPQVFNDVPQQYPKLLATLNQYSEIQTSFGTVALTHPKELNNGQSAVSNKPGTLIFAKPGRDLSEDDWKAFFNTLRLYKS